MGLITDHKRRIKEHFDKISDAIDEGVEKSPVTIGFHCSACATELLETYLHATNRIPSGKVIKHSWFARPKQGQKIKALAERKVGVDFPDKDNVYELLYTIEEHRDKLVYGKASLSQINEVLESFQALKNILVQKLNQEGVEIEEN